MLVSEKCRFLEISMKRKKSADYSALFVYQYEYIDKFGGDGGIRTHVPLRTTRFRVELVMTSSIRLRL